METTEMVPKLRFPDFHEDWNKVKLRDVSRYFNGGSFEGDVMKEGKYELITLKSINVNGELVSSKRFIDNETTTLSKGTLIMILSEQAPGLLGMTTIIPEDNKYVLNQRVAEIRPSNKAHNLFLSLSINVNQRYFSKHGAGTKVQNISKPNVEKFEFCLPEKKEQQKIASFLSSVDGKISQLEKKKSLLETYKRGIMQKIFSQELRFKDENGQEFPEWEEKRLGDISFITTGKSNRSSSGLHGEYAFFDRSDDIRTSSIYLFDCEAIIMPGEGSEFPPKYFIGKFDLHQRAYAIMNFKDTFGKFLYYYVEQHKSYFVKYAVGSTVKSLRLPIFDNMSVRLPCKTEQQKIASFLSSIDKKIEITSTQLEKTRKFKKGLLQQMFV